MNASFLPDQKPVTLSNLHAIHEGDQGQPVSREGHRDGAAADVLFAQARSRIAAALGATVVQLAIVLWTSGSGHPAPMLGAALVYTAFVGALAIIMGHWRRASPAVVTLALTGDLAFIFAMTVTGTSPVHYERAMFGSIIVIHLANVYFGRRQAWRIVALATAGYLALITSGLSLTNDRVEELWSLAIGAVGTGVVLVHAGYMRRRLRTIVKLFERAEEGDFSHAYDEAADSRPDAITRVGRAYNRVRTQLASMVLTDPLTGCLNRRGFDQALAREIARSTRAGSELALLAIDLDHFKSINDTHGHLAGDEVLRAAGVLLNHTKRAGDIVARLGGEEFALLLPDTGAAAAFQVATRVCDVLRRQAFPAGTPGGQPIRLTTSIGVVAGAPELDRDYTVLFTARADAALYAAKRSGRDRVRAWSSHDMDDTQPRGEDLGATLRR
jgi:diguanylate cyclase (GGDEF)-like protein